MDLCVLACRDLRSTSGVFFDCSPPQFLIQGLFTEFGAYRLCSAGWRMGFWDLPALTQCWGSRCKLPGFLLDISCLSSVSSTHSPPESPVETQKLVLYHVPLIHALNLTTRNQNKQANHNKNLSYFFLK